MRGRTTQRTDSTYVLAWVRDLTRLELITEAVRAPCGLPGRASESLRSYRIVLVRHGPCTRAGGLDLSAEAGPKLRVLGLRGVDHWLR